MLYAFTALKTLNHKNVYTNDVNKDVFNMANHFLADEFNYIWEYFKNKSSFGFVMDPYVFLTHYTKMCINDTRHNLYALEYLLANENWVRSTKNFSFMGTPDERIRKIKQDIERLKDRYDNGDGV